MVIVSIGHERGDDAADEKRALGGVAVRYIAGHCAVDHDHVTFLMDCRHPGRRWVIVLAISRCPRMGYKHTSTFLLWN